MILNFHRARKTKKQNKKRSYIKATAGIEILHNWDTARVQPSIATSKIKELRKNQKKKHNKFHTKFKKQNEQKNQ